MKKTQVAAGGDGTRRSGSKTVGEYFARVPQPARRILMHMRKAIRESVPRDAVEVISYRMPAFRRGQVLVWYGAFARHVSLFPGGSVLGAFEDELEELKTSRGTVQFPIDKPLPIRLIKKIVKTRVEQVNAKGPRRKRRNAGAP
jgi:uncharacterized protein YdhG (YjbR/CyaY superfamily)